MLESLIIFIIIITVIGFATTLTSPQFHTSQISYTLLPPTDQSPSHTLSVLHLVFVQCFPGLQLPFLFLFTACLSQVQPHPSQAGLPEARGCSHLVCSTHISNPLCNGLESGSWAYCHP